MALTEKLQAGVTRLITKDQFIYMLDKWVLEPELRHELILAFKVSYYNTFYLDNMRFKREYHN